MTHSHSRRRLLAGLAAIPLATALPAQTAPRDWSAIGDIAANWTQCHALLILQNGSEVLRRRFRGPEIGQPVPIKSVSKTIVAALTGAALDRGALPSVDAPLGQVAPRLIPSGADPAVAGITVEDLVTLRAGLERTSGANYGGWVSSGNWVANALSRPIVAEPGGRMLYSTGSTHVLGAVLAEVTGRSLLDLARDWLGQPLAIDIPPWTRDPQGRYLGGNEMALSLPAMARFGEMARQGGVWNGTRVLSADWIARSFTPVTRSPYSGLSYGYGWFLGTAGGTDYALARGYGGQVICVAPRIGLTVVLTSDPLQPARSGGYFGEIMRLIEGEILPTARAAA